MSRYRTRQVKQCSREPTQSESSVNTYSNLKPHPQTSRNASNIPTYFTKSALEDAIRARSHAERATTRTGIRLRTGVFETRIMRPYDTMPHWSQKSSSIYISCEGLRLEGRKGREGGGLVFFWKKKGRGNRLSEEDW